MEPARRVVSGKHAAARNVSGSGSHSQYLAHLKLGVLHCVSRMEDRDTAHSAVRELQALLRGASFSVYKATGATSTSSGRSLSELGIEGLTVILNALISGYKGSMKASTRRECINAFSYISRDDTNCPLTDLMHQLLEKSTSFLCRCFKDPESSVRSVAEDALGLLAFNANLYGGGPQCASAIVRIVIDMLMSEGCQIKEVQASSCNALSRISPHAESFSQLDGSGGRPLGLVEGNNKMPASGWVLERLMRLFTSPTFHAHASLLHLFGNCEESKYGDSLGCSGLVIAEAELDEVRDILPSLTLFAESILQCDGRIGKVENFDWQARVSAACYLRCIMTYFGPELFEQKSTRKCITTRERLMQVLSTAKTDRMKPIRDEVHECLVTLSILTDTMRNNGGSITSTQWRRRFNHSFEKERREDHGNSNVQLQVKDMGKHVSANKRQVKQTYNDSGKNNRYSPGKRIVAEAFMKGAVEKDTIVGAITQSNSSKGEIGDEDVRAMSPELLELDSNSLQQEKVEIRGEESMRNTIMMETSENLYEPATLTEVRNKEGEWYEEDPYEIQENDDTRSAPEDDDETISEVPTDSIITELNNNLRLHTDSPRLPIKHHHHHHQIPSLMASSRYSLQQHQNFEEQIRFLQQQQGDLINMVMEMREVIEENFMTMSSRVTAVTSLVRSIQENEQSSREAKSNIHYRRDERSRRDLWKRKPQHMDLSSQNFSDYSDTTLGITDDEGSISSAQRNQGDRGAIIEKEKPYLRRQRRQWENDKFGDTSIGPLGTLSASKSLSQNDDDEENGDYMPHSDSEKLASRSSDNVSRQGVPSQKDEADLSTRVESQRTNPGPTEGHHFDRASFTPEIIDHLVNDFESEDGNQSAALAQFWNLLNDDCDSLNYESQNRVLKCLDLDSKDAPKSALSASLQAQARALKDALQEKWKKDSPTVRENDTDKIEFESDSHPIAPAPEAKLATTLNDKQLSTGNDDYGLSSKSDESDVRDVDRATPKSRTDLKGDFDDYDDDDIISELSELSTQHVEEIAKRMDAIASQVEQLSHAPLDVIGPQIEQFQREILPHISPNSGHRIKNERSSDSAHSSPTESMKAYSVQ